MRQLSCVVAITVLTLSNLTAATAPGKVPQWMVGKWKGTTRIGPPENGINEELLFECGDEGEFAASSRITYTDADGQVQVLDERSGHVTRGTWSVSGAEEKKFRMKAKVKGDGPERQSVIERLDADTLQDESGFVLKRVKSEAAK